MPTETSTSVTSTGSTNTAEITVTVVENTGPGGGAGQVDVFLSVTDGRATFTTSPTAPTPPNYVLNGSNTVVAWRNLAFTSNNPVDVTCTLTKAAGTGSFCLPVRGVATGVFQGVPFSLPVELTVCYF